MRPKPAAREPGGFAGWAESGLDAATMTMVEVHKAAQLELLANEVAPGLVLSWLVVNVL